MANIAPVRAVRARAPRRCSNCNEVGHIITTCQDYIHNVEITFDYQMGRIAYRNAVRNTVRNTVRNADRRTVTHNESTEILVILNNLTHTQLKIVGRGWGIMRYVRRPQLIEMLYPLCIRYVQRFMISAISQVTDPTPPPVPVKKLKECGMLIQDEDEETNFECAICIDTKPFTDKVETNCRHSFCGDCMDSCMERNYGPTSCPLCRTTITTLYMTCVELHNKMYNKYIV